MQRKLIGERGIDAILDSLSELDRREETLTRQREAEIHELVLHLSKIKGGRASAVLSGISVLNGAERQNASAALEHTAFCREYLAAFPGRADYKRSIFFGSDDRSSEKTALGYLKNEYSERAAEIFSGLLPSCERETAQSFDAMCEDIYSGRLDYGIIPISNGRDGRLPVFYELINRYELKIVLACSVGADEGEKTLFSLAGKSIPYPETPFGEPTSLELFVTPGGGQSLTEMFRAAETCGMELQRIDSFGFSSVGEGVTFSPVFSAEGAEIGTFLLYMTAVFPQYTPIGIYRMIR